MQNLAVVHFPQINIDEIEKFREKYDPGWKIIRPHITIVSPLSEIPENQLIEHIESIVNDIKSFPIHVTGLVETPDEHLFLQIKEGNEEIDNLHRKLYSAILTPYIPTDFPFEPHITLGFFGIKDDSLFSKAYAEAKAMNIDMTFDFDSISIIKGDGLSPAITVKTVSLQ